MKKIKLIILYLVGISLAYCDGFKLPLQAELEKTLGLDKKTNYDLLIAGGAALAAGGDEQITQEELFDVTFSLGDSYGIGYHDAITTPWYTEVSYPNLIVKQAFPNDPSKYLTYNQYYFGVDLYEVPYIDPTYSKDIGGMCDIEMILSGGKTIHNPDTLGVDCESVLLNDATNGIMIKPAAANARAMNYSVEGWTFTDQLHVSGVCAHKYGVDPDDPTDDCADGAPNIDAQLAYNHSNLTAVEKAESVKPTMVNLSTAGNHVLCAALAMNNDCITPGVGDDFRGRTPEQSFLEDSNEVFERMTAIDSVKGTFIWNLPYVNVLPYLKKWDDEVDYSAKCENVASVEIGKVCYESDGTTVKDCGRTSPVPGGGTETQLDSDGDTINDDVDVCPTVADVAQTDTDGDGKGDACTDTDADGFSDAIDNCPTNANGDQLDNDSDGQGDTCDNNDDGDLVNDTTDACPLNPNFTTNANLNCNITDANDDNDNDGVLNGTDTCDLAKDATNTDSDGDGTGDVCDDQDGDSIMDAVDNCLADSSIGNINTDGDATCDDGELDGDIDGDGIADSSDVCMLVSDPSQTDSDSDGFGDACDTDPTTADTSDGSSVSLSSTDVGESCGDSSDTYGVSLAGVEGCNYSTLSGIVAVEVTDTYRTGNTKEETYTCVPSSVTPTGANRGDSYTGRTGFFITDVDSADIVLDNEEQSEIVKFTDEINQHLLDLSIQYDTAYADFLTMLGTILINGGRPIVNPDSGKVIGLAQMYWPLPDNNDGTKNPGCFTYAGVHPTNYCQVVIANELIKTINAQYSLNIGLIDEYTAYQNDYYNKHPFDIEAYLDDETIGQLLSTVLNTLL